MTAKRNTEQTCPKCGGSGWLVVEEEDGREVARRCECALSEFTDRLIQSARIPSKYAELTLDNFDPYRPELKAAKTVAEEFIDSYPAVEKGLLLIGPPGTGKTHLATALLVEAIRKCRIRGLFCDYREFIRSIQNSYNPSTETTEMSIIKPVMDAELLFMDELGALQPTGWVLDTITYVLNNRYSNERITVITSNYHVETRDLEKAREEQEDVFLKQIKNVEDKFPTAAYKSILIKLLEGQTSSIRWEYPLQDRIGPRLMSRLYEMCRFVPFDGVPDYRRRSTEGLSRFKSKPK